MDQDSFVKYYQRILNYKICIKININFYYSRRIEEIIAGGAAFNDRHVGFFEQMERMMEHSCLWVREEDFFIEQKFQMRKNI